MVSRLVMFLFGAIGCSGAQAAQDEQGHKRGSRHSAVSS